MSFICSLEHSAKFRWILLELILYQYQNCDIDLLFSIMFQLYFSQESSYRAIDVTVTTPEGSSHICRTYQLDENVEEMLPSPHYMKVLIEGAKQSGLPASFVKHLEAIPHNGDSNPPPIMATLFKAIPTQAWYIYIYIYTVQTELVIFLVKLMFLVCFS